MLSQLPVNTTNSVNTEYNFDNIGQALVVVFITSTADNWQDTMYTGIDSVDVGKNLVYDYNLWNSLFYVIVTMLSCFFWANMFVSTLVDQYTKASEAEGVLAMNDVQQNAALQQALLFSSKTAETLGRSRGERRLHARVRIRTRGSDGS